MEKTFFRGLAERGPFVILDRRLYQMTDTPTEGMSFNMGAARMGLVPAATLDQLERYYINANSAQVEEVGREYIHKRLDKEMKTEAEFKKHLNGNKALQFVVYEVFPHFMDKEDDLETMLKGGAVEEHEETDAAARILEEISTEDVPVREFAEVKRCIMDELEKEYGAQVPAAAKKKKQAKQESDDLDALLTDHYQKIGVLQPGKKEGAEVRQGNGLVEILETADVLVIGGEVYRLVSKDGNSDMVIIAGEKVLVPEYFTSVEKVEQAYQNTIEKKAKLDAIDRYEDQVRQIEDLRSKSAALEGLSKKKQFEMGEVGFVNYGRYVQVYIKVPKFAMKNPELKDEYYAFAECRIGVSVQHYDGNVHLGKPFIFGDYWHPFNWGSNGICNAMDWETQRSRYDKATRVAKTLSDAKNVVMNGFSKRSLKKHGGLSIDTADYQKSGMWNELQARKLTKKQAEERGYQLTNMLWK